MIRAWAIFNDKGEFLTANRHGEDEAWMCWLRRIGVLTVRTKAQSMAALKSKGYTCRPVEIKEVGEK